MAKTPKKTSKTGKKRGPKAERLVIAPEHAEAALRRLLNPRKPR